MSHAASKSSALMVCAFGLSERTLRFVQNVFEEQLAGAYVLGAEETADVGIIDLDIDGGRAEFERQQERHPDRMIVLLTSDEASARALNGFVMAKPVHLDQFVKAMNTIAEWISGDAGEGGHGQEESMPVASGEAMPSSARLSARGKSSREAAGAEVNASRRVRAKSGSFAEETEHVLATLQPRTRHYYLGTQPDVDLCVPEERSKVFYEPGEFLQGFVQRAIRTGIETASVMVLSGTRFGSIEVYPFARLARASATSAALYAAARMPLAENEVAIEPAPELPQMPLNHEGIEPLDALLWRLALWASRGHVPSGTDLDEAVVLKHWPNLSRLLFPPHATQIVALWARRATPLAVSASALGIPQRYVFASYSACAALDLIRAERRAAPRPAAPQSPAPAEKHTLFGMLRKKFAQGRSD